MFFEAKLEISSKITELEMKNVSVCKVRFLKFL